MKISFMPQPRGRGRRSKELLRLRHETHGMSMQLDQHVLERRDKETRAWIIPTSALEGLARFLGVVPSSKENETEGQRRSALIHAIMREEKRLSKCPRVDRWKRPGGHDHEPKQEESCDE